MKNLPFIIFLIVPFILFCRSKEQSFDTIGVAEPEREQINHEVQAPGREVYEKHCMACHQTDGSGVPGFFPPLVNTDWVSGNKERLIGTVLFGLEGPIEVNGELYSNVMPRQSYLSDKEIADVLTYIRTHFDNRATPVHPEEVAGVRKKGNK